MIADSPLKGVSSKVNVVVFNDKGASRVVVTMACGHDFVSTVGFQAVESAQQHGRQLRNINCTDCYVEGIEGQ